MQPHIKAHSPLCIEIHSGADHKIVHAFEFHNWKRLGEGYDGLPADADAAAARVAERLNLLPELVGKLASPTEVSLSDRAPLTLDLRSL